MRFSNRTFAVILVLGLSSLAACGGDAKTSAQSTPPPASSSNPVASLLSSTECLQVSQALAVAVSGGFASGGSLDPDDAVANLQRVAESAPDTVKTDLALLSVELRKFYEALKSAGADFNNPNTFSNPQTLQALGAAAASFQSSGAQAASDRIQSYFRQICPS